MVDSIAKTLGSGSGIDITALVTNLVDAQFSQKSDALTKREETLKAQVSAAATLKSAIAGFSGALSSLAKGGTLSTQPTSSDASVLKVSALAGAKIGTLSNTIQVNALATAQVAVTRTARPVNEPVGTGTIQIAVDNLGDGSFTGSGTPIEITAADDTLSGIAAKINAAQQGVTAQVVNDGTGERLIFKGQTGAKSAFRITATDAGTPGLAAAIGVGGSATNTQIQAVAGDAELSVDGITVTRPSNSVSDLVPGVKLDLVAVGTRPVTLGSTTPSDVFRSTVNDFVLTYNDLLAELKKETDPVSGSLAKDDGAKQMLRTLRGLTLVDLTGATDGSPKSLAEIGVATNKDGSLRVETTQLNAAITKAPQALAAMFADNGLGASKKGLPAALASISLAVSSRTSGLGASETRYQGLQKKLATDKTTVDADRKKLTQRLTQTYASMDSRVAAYKATGSFLTNQIAAWNKSNG